MPFHSGSGINAVGSIPTSNINISMEARFGVNHASEQALAHLLLASHEVHE